MLEKIVTGLDAFKNRVIGLGPLKAGGITLVGVILFAGIYWIGVVLGWHGLLHDTGTIQGSAVDDGIIRDRTNQQLDAAEGIGARGGKQILFGDLHVHTTYSTDAFLFALPMMGGQGMHPLADACDYARYCSAIDFWAIADHSEASSPRKWENAKQSIRQCNALAQDQSNPDVVAFMGFEWTQVGSMPSNHYGHKNVIFKGLEDEDISARAIAASGVGLDALRKNGGHLPAALALLDWSNRQDYYDFRAFMDEVRATPLCPADVPSSELPASCLEVAPDPGDLVSRLEDQQLEYLLIPHGTSWGLYTPPGTTFDKQLLASMRPEAQELIEVYSGHGNSEEYRSWRAVDLNGSESDYSTARCPAPSRDYIPPCWRAGEIIEERCLKENIDAAECTKRAEKTRQDYVSMSIAGHLTVSGEHFTEWLDSGQCIDCFLPTFQHRPGVSVQYGLAISSFEDGKEPARFNWGFIGSSDNHQARAGTGYKEYDFEDTEMWGPRNEEWAQRLRKSEPPLSYSQPTPMKELLAEASLGLTETERQNSFFVTGGLAAVHSEGRSREQIWAAMKRKETYATSGPRILLWFNLLDGQESPMGATRNLRSTPRFEVRAVGSFKQKNGCPAYASNGMSMERLGDLCGGECYNPSDERHLITRIEVVRIRPQSYPGEPIEKLIDDPFKVIECKPQQEGCSAEFSDPSYSGRQT